MIQHKAIVLESMKQKIRWNKMKPVQMEVVSCELDSIDVIRPPKPIRQTLLHELGDPDLSWEFAGMLRAGFTQVVKQLTESFASHVATWHFRRPKLTVLGMMQFQELFCFVLGTGLFRAASHTCLSCK